jgi:transposase InsO family protein
MESFSMYKIIGQPINMRYIATSNIVAKEPSEEAKQIIHIAEFGLKYGYRAAVEAFSISKSSYYNYVKRYKLSQSYNMILEVKSKRPHNIRKASWDKRIVRFICRLREKRANIGKSKIKYYLDEYCAKLKIASISTGTIQNIINSFPNKLRTKKSEYKAKRRDTVLRKPAKYSANLSGECLSLDSMEFRRNGKKLYVVVAQDEATNLLFARGTLSHTSRSAKIILEKAHNYLPWDKYNIILTDNGSEFGKDFAKFIQEQNVTHYHTYPKTPKQNARCERVNRTIQEEFMIKHGNLLFEDLNLFNKKLDKYLHWYNFKRVHARFGNKMTPFQRHLELAKDGKIVS